jgi:hypothetical protein
LKHNIGKWLNRYSEILRELAIERFVVRWGQPDDAYYRYGKAIEICQGLAPKYDSLASAMKGVTAEYIQNTGEFARRSGESEEEHKARKGELHDRFEETFGRGFLEHCYRAFSNGCITRKKDNHPISFQSDYAARDTFLQDYSFQMDGEKSPYSAVGFCQLVLDSFKKEQFYDKNPILLQYRSDDAHPWDCNIGVHTFLFDLWFLSDQYTVNYEQCVTSR